mmetsp:Transcript_46326/g.75871  ORF Transcript_46326/g.75871 Transcript_46326/m.75871 type:complete len:467 (+) Transcript_46326:481-1881(+)
MDPTGQLDGGQALDHQNRRLRAAPGAHGTEPGRMEEVVRVKRAPGHGPPGGAGPDGLAEAGAPQRPAAGEAAVLRGADGQLVLGAEVRGESAVRFGGLVRRLGAPHAADLCAVVRVRPHGAVLQLCGGEGLCREEETAEPGSGPGPQGGGHDQQCHQRRRVGLPPELPFVRLVDAGAGEDPGGAGAEGVARGLPPVAHDDAGVALPDHGPPERPQDREGAPERHARQPARHHRQRAARVLVGGLHEGVSVEEAGLLPRVLPRPDSGAAQVRAFGLERAVRVQQLRPQHCAEVPQDIFGGFRRDPVAGGQLHFGGHLLRRACDGFLGPAVRHVHAQDLLELGCAGAGPQLHPRWCVLPAGTGTVEWRVRLPLHTPNVREPRGVRPAPQCRHQLAVGGVQFHEAKHPRCNWRRRWRRWQLRRGSGQSGAGAAGQTARPYRQAVSPSVHLRAHKGWHRSVADDGARAGN